jgi:hypothetical protein
MAFYAGFDMNPVTRLEVLDGISHFQDLRAKFMSHDARPGCFYGFIDRGNMTMYHMDIRGANSGYGYPGDGIGRQD